jgi:hypothetical protein
MALPAAVQYGQVTWTAVSAVADSADPDAAPDAVPVTGSVTFTPSARVLLAAGVQPVTVFATSPSYDLDSAGVLRDSSGRPAVTLVATDSPGLNPAGWTWTASYRLNDGLVRGSFSFALPAGATVDLTTVAPVSAANGVPVVQGPQGEPGPQGPQGPPGQVQADGSTSLTLRSAASRTADTTRLRVVSYQKQETENGRNGGEGVWLDLADPRAKNMLTWRLAMDKAARTIRPVAATPVAPAESDMQRIVWAGAHYFAQDQADYANPTDVHGHWSVEVPDSGLDLRTRFEIRYVGPDGKIGLDRTLVQTENADLTVDTSLGCRLRLRSGPGSDRLMEVANDEWGTQPRWRWGAPGDQAETGGSAGSNFAIQGFSDANVKTSTPLAIKRSNGQVYVGGSSVIPGDTDGSSEGLQVNRNHSGTAFAVNSNLTGGGGVIGYAHQALDAASRTVDARVGADVTARFVAFADGKHEWGPGGSTARDTNLYRAQADVLKTDDVFKTGASVTGSRPAAATVGQGGQWFDTTLNRPIWSTGSAWVDAAGNTV